MTNINKAIFWALYILAVAIEFTYWAGKTSAAFWGQDRASFVADSECQWNRPCRRDEIGFPG